MTDWTFEPTRHDLPRVAKRKNDWWRGAVVYQIYPRSFLDTNGDGVGDLPGITAKLEHVASLGVDAIWISPFMKSPQKDYGYDVADYCDVDPLFGTLADFDTLLAKAHALGLKVLIDFVPSHTSDQHPWFQEARQSRSNPKADWYCFVDAKPDGTPPNNWQAVFGGAAWEWEPRRGQYYLHNFLKEQPQLNFHNPAVVAALLEAAEFWLKRGVDGFRLDAVDFAVFDPQLRDNPPRPESADLNVSGPRRAPYAMQFQRWNKARPELADKLFKPLFALTERYRGDVLLAEISGERALERIAEYTQGGGVDIAYSFDLLTCPPTAAGIRCVTEELERHIGDGWGCFSLSNHDVTRATSRFSPDRPPPEALRRLLPVMLTCLRATVCLYQGEELGLEEAELAFEQLQDPYGITFWPMYKGRDGCRTPMPWSAGAPHAGFTTGTPWLPVPESHRVRAVDVQATDPSSCLAHVSAFLTWRRKHAALSRGSIAFLPLAEPVLAFTRTHGDDRLLCLFNLGDTSASSPIPARATLLDVPGAGGTIVGSTVSLSSWGYAFASLSADDAPGVGQEQSGSTMTQTLDLAVIGNGSVAAILDREARIVWYCLPRFDGDPVFCNLLAGDEDKGYFEVELADLARTEQAYDRNTAVLVTTLTDRSGGVVRITDFCPRFKRFERFYRPRMIARRIEPVAGAPVIRLKMRPTFEYGGREPGRTSGSNHLRYIGPDFAIRLTTDVPVSFVEQESPFALVQPMHLVLGSDEVIEDSLPHLWRELHERTRDYWVEWSRSLSIPFEYQDAIIRAAITLKLCAFEESGAIVAALTTSIPEAPHTERNWDYRCCWLRDAYFVVQALNRLGATLTMEDHLRWITTVVALEHGQDMKPVYAILPDQSLAESHVESLKGYSGMGPVRRGNLAYVQRQHDTYGNVILAAAQMFYDRRLPQSGDLALFQRLEGLGEYAARFALEPDAGLWEFRGKARVHTHSAAMCWAGCHRLAKVAGLLGLPERGEYWRAHAARIREAILAQGWNAEINSFTACFGGSDLDASLLLLHEIGFLAANDPRFVGTVEAIEKRLLKGGHLIRYDAEDDFGLPEVSFIICTFWYIDALAAMGRRDEARALFEDLLARRNHVGLLTEDLNPQTGELWGNIPQAYSMVGIIISGMRLSKSWEEAFWRDAS